MYGAVLCLHGPVLGPWGQGYKDELLSKGLAAGPLEHSKLVGSYWMTVTSLYWLPA